MKVILRKLIKFLLVGGFCTGLQYAILFGLVEWNHWQATAASSLGFALSALVNYIFNYRFTFKATLGHRKALPRFVVTSGSGLVLNGAIMQAGIVYTTVPYLWCQLAATVVVLFWNFIGSLKWSYA